MKKGTLILSALNLLAASCLVAFVLSARDMAVAEGRDSYDFGDSASFFVMVAPALVLCLVADAIWAGVALVALAKRRDSESAIACVVVLVGWTVVFAASRQWAQLPSGEAAGASTPIHLVR
ncbi:MAG: hypothetical protein H7276_04795 [Caulobacter sp.]|nr:hypothetical protein [Vitreoscilla sp.]